MEDESVLIKLLEVAVGLFNPLPTVDATPLAVRDAVFLSAAAFLGELCLLD